MIIILRDYVSGLYTWGMGLGIRVMGLGYQGVSGSWAWGIRGYPGYRPGVSGGIRVMGLGYQGVFGLWAWGIRGYQGHEPGVSGGIRVMGLGYQGYEPGVWEVGYP
jgi:hypothetical protein